MAPQEGGCKKAMRQLHLACNGTAVTKVISPRGHESMHKRKTRRSPQGCVCNAGCGAFDFNNQLCSYHGDRADKLSLRTRALAGQCPERDVCVFVAMGA